MVCSDRLCVFHLRGRQSADLDRKFRIVLGPGISVHDWLRLAGGCHPPRAFSFDVFDSSTDQSPPQMEMDSCRSMSFCSRGWQCPWIAPNYLALPSWELRYRVSYCPLW